MAELVAGQCGGRGRPAAVACLSLLFLETGHSLRLPATDRRGGVDRSAGGRGRRAAAGPIVRFADAAIRRTASLPPGARSAAPRFAHRPGQRAGLEPGAAALDAVDARGGRYRNRWSAGTIAVKLTCAAYMASRPIARSWRDNGRSRRPVAADRGLAGSGPAVAGRAAAAPRLNLLHCKTVLDAGRATADILGVVRRTTNPTPQTEPQPWLKPAPAFSTSTLPRS